MYFTSFSISRFLYVIIIYLLIGTTISCKEKEEIKVPDNILSKEKMTNVLTDFHIMEAAMNLNLMQDGNFSRDTIGFYTIFSNNKITKAEYKESFEFYSAHPELLNEIYEGVLTELSKKQAEVNKKK